jgi:DNA helicase-2/ATP-dependent DNA helicase PcrA
MPHQVTKLFGPPGTGKTTRLLSVMEEHLTAGVRPEKIGFISFTQKAANEARERAMERFGLPEKALPYFRTIHSLVFRQLGMRRDQVLSWQHWRELGDKLGMRFEGRAKIEDGQDLYGMGRDDRIRFLESLSRTKKEPLEHTWRNSNEDDLTWWELERFARALAEYKRTRQLSDFTDMLDQFCALAHKVVPTLDVLILDEAQDLSRSQWEVYRALAPSAGRIYVAGDDDQAIYNWAGADVNEFLSLEGTVEVLDQSFRVPSAVHKTALTVSSRISNRQAKTWKPKGGSPGAIHWRMDPTEADLSAGTWLLLARNGYMLAELEQLCLDAGFSFSSVGKSPLDSPALKAIFTWERLRKGTKVSKEEIEPLARYMSHQVFPARSRQMVQGFENTPLGLVDLQRIGLLFQGDAPAWFDALDRMPKEEAEYFRAARRRGETLSRKPRISISTIHAAKGGEAEHVMVLTDVSAKSYESMANNPDDEARVFYVGLTRAQQTLHLIEPRTGMYYPL